MRERRIEFIGDSHTVGYGNLSPRRECSESEVWATTDNTRAYGPLLAARYGADYRVNAISGRGVVRNYDGMDVATLPQAYPFALFDGRTPVADDGWRPQVVVIAPGTNDFSTPLRAGERWKDRAALHADYERGYVAFVQALRTRYPHARIVLWSTDLFDGEIRSEVERVLVRLQQAGETRTSFIPVGGLEMGAAMRTRRSGTTGGSPMRCPHTSTRCPPPGTTERAHGRVPDQRAVVIQREPSRHGRRRRNSTRYTPAAHASPAAQPPSTSDG